jgi:hypothetical protein
MRAFTLTFVRAQRIAVIIALAALVALDARAFSAAPGSLAGRTNKDGGSGCGSCHAFDSGLSVTLSGPASVPVRGNATITLTATKASAGAGVKLGMAAAASIDALSEFSSFLARVEPSGEIIHSALGGSGGTLATTNASGAASYTFRFTMPDDAAVGSTQTIYALARLGGVHGWNHAANFTLTAAANAPPAPTIGAASAGDAQVSVVFAPPATTGGSPITGYTVTSSPGNLTASGTASPITVTGLTNGTTYTFTVTASNAIGESLASAPSAPVVPGIAPSAPLNVMATRGNASASVAFDPPAVTGTGPISQYTVTSTPGGISATGGASPIVVDGLVNGTSYTFTVKATNSFGAGAESASSNAVTPQPIPGAPSNLMAVASNAQVTLSFAAAADGGSPITSYVVNVTPSAGTDSGAGTAALTRTIGGLSNGTSYTFTVSAVNAFGGGPASAPASATPFTVPGPPVNVVAAPGNGSATVTFQMPSSNGGAPITGYTVTSNPPGGVDANAGGTGLTHTINNLTNGVSYTFTVSASNAAGSGPASAPSAAVTIGTANSPQVVWTRVLARADFVDLVCVAPNATRGPAMDAAGNVFVAGCSRTESGSEDVIVQKLEAATGNVLWSATQARDANSFQTGMSNEVLSDNAGHAILITRITDPMKSYAPVQLTKFSGSDGQVIWSTGYASQTGTEPILGADRDANGDILLNGNSVGGIHTVKISGATGAQLWEATTSRYAAGVAVAPNGDVIATGNADQNNRDFRVVKYAGTTGAVVWDTTWEGPTAGGYDAGLAAAVDSTGHVFVVGDTSPGTALVKFDAATGAVLWAVTRASARFNTVSVDGSGHVVVSGSAGSFPADLFTAKYNGATGALMWSQSFNGTANDQDVARRIALDGSGNAVVVGTSRSSVGFDNIRVIKYRSSDGAVIWSHEYVSGLNDIGFQVGIAPDGAAIITGMVRDTSTTDPTLVVQKLADPAPPPSLALLAVASRKTHGGAGDFDVPLARGVPVTGAVSIEPRAAGAGHRIVFSFDGAVTNPGTAVLRNAAGQTFGSATPTIHGNEVLVTLSGVPDATRASVELSGVDGAVSATVALGFLLGDVNGSRNVDGSDATALRAQSGQTPTNDTARFDINATGRITAADIALVKARLGRALP